MQCNEEQYSNSMTTLGPPVYTSQLPILLATQSCSLYRLYSSPGFPIVYLYHSIGIFEFPVLVNVIECILAGSLGYRLLFLKNCGKLWKLLHLALDNHLLKSAIMKLVLNLSPSKNVIVLTLTGKLHGQSRPFITAETCCCMDKVVTVTTPI